MEQSSVVESKSEDSQDYDNSVLRLSKLTDQKTIGYPYEFYSALRSDSPVHYDEALGLYLVSRYKNIDEILHNTEVFSVEKGIEKQFSKGFSEEFNEILIRDGGGHFPESILTDPPYHTRVRRLMEKAFTAHRVKQISPMIRKIAVDLIDGIADRGHADGVRDLAVPLAARTISQQLGFVGVDDATIRRWSGAMTAQIGMLQSREEMLIHAKSMCEMQNYLIDRIHERQERPYEDMISDLVWAQTGDEAAPRLTFKETVALARALLVAGSETTATSISNLLFMLATRPEVAELLHDASDDDLRLSRFVEEFFRIEPPVRGLSRVTTREVELAGVRIPAGSQLLLLFASANDDREEFDDPRAFRMDRGNLARHLSFGSGAHRCIGMALARIEIKIMAQEVIRRLTDIKLAVSADEISYAPTIAARSILALPLTFSRRSS